MVKRLAALSVALCVTGTAVAPAGAAATNARTKAFSASFTYAMLSSGSGPGVVRDRDLGKGMIVILPPNAGGPVTACYPTGCIVAQYNTAATVRPDHSSTVTGTLIVSGGTGTFKSATGQAAFAASQAADGTGRGRATGNITY